MNERRILATTRHSDVLKYHPGIRRSEKRPCEEDKVVLLLSYLLRQCKLAFAVSVLQKIIIKCS